MKERIGIITAVLGAMLAYTSLICASGNASDDIMTIGVLMIFVGLAILVF